jgi:nuclear transport factor 2 (NTF2) superfamily protein
MKEILIAIPAIYLFLKLTHTYTLYITKGKHYRLCPICNSEMDDEYDAGILVDYICPQGCYEYHFDCGQWNIRIGQRSWNFWDIKDIEELRKQRNQCIEEIKACGGFHRRSFKESFWYLLLFPKSAC